MLTGGVKALEVNRPVIDELNVFPVPDGDTGTNMSLTLASALREYSALGATSDLGEIASAFSKGALHGARGNSGVILSQILKGFSVAFDAKIEADAKDFATALRKGTEIAYGAVQKPKEGTILTVVRIMAETATSLSRKRKLEFEEFLAEVIKAGETILMRTPEMLPVLAKAGVVEKMLYLHVTTPTQLCYYFGQEMKRRRHGYILNMSSLSCWLPYPGITLYASTKRYLKSLSRGLRSELRDYGVSVTVLCPGAIATNLYNLSDNLKSLAIHLGIMMRPEKLARKGINALFRRRYLLVPGLLNKVFTPIAMIIPHGLVRWIMRKTGSLRLD